MSTRDSVLRQFDFAKVRRAMRAAGHRWARTRGDKTERYHPTEDELRETAARMLERAEREGGRHHAGGLTASLVGTVLRLEYVVETAEAEVE